LKDLKGEMKTYHLEKISQVDKPLQEVFEFFSEAENLGRITPPNLRFEILTPTPIEMKVGTLIDYRIKIYNIPFYWRTEITIWDPPHRFVDVQLKGPYKSWIHEHRFKEKDGITLMTDTIEYQVPGGYLAPLLHQLKIKKDVEKIFEYREKIITEIFSSHSGTAHGKNKQEIFQ
jgi:ligand-binding SRPBCC domain-containing protein